ncbi:DUF998 domain-containing protein [Dactylosporangium cerinum]
MRLAPFWKHLTAVAHTLPADIAVMGDTIEGRPLDRDPWARIEVPVLVLDGGKSSKATGLAADQLADRLPAGQRATLPGQGHNVAMPALERAIRGFAGLLTLLKGMQMPTVSGRLLAGVVSPVLFLAVSYLQMPFNPGLDLTRHAFSYLSIGDTGPIQQTNFVVMGLLNIVAATGLRQAVGGRLGTATAILLALDGLGQIIAGLFTLDPSNGFPAGAPAGLPETVSTHGNLHGVGFGLSMVSWLALLLLLGRVHKDAGDRGWARLSILAAAALLVTAACLMLPFGTVLLYVVLSSTWLFMAATFQHFRLRRQRSPRPRPRAVPGAGRAAGRGTR